MRRKKYGKRLRAFLLILSLLLILCSCGSNASGGAGTGNGAGADNGNEASFSLSSKQNGVIEIPEDFFLTQVNDIYTNAEDYLGRPIKYQGIFEASTYGEGENQQQILYVFRNSPGCCGNDGTAGFEVLWDGEIPEEHAWVEVEGVLQAYEDADGNKFLQVKLDSLNVLKERGKEFVSQ
ncbi:hypothetical protein [Clostridium aminobutyricum]|uniref:DUF1980 domain-containing protein n=1 Tax=Clostridium aminobutyricum TaxID=33953 RepID=A0A939IJB8_CLOAM|nr:hypothetical protein [Clostridium aminobutyricum]MBN7773414.1 hypothetical protein [Clostridium aminobutyricum]